MGTFLHIALLSFTKRVDRVGYWHGYCRVPARYKTREGYTLGRWISNLRQSKIKDTLEEERLIILDSLGMIWDPLAEEFERYFTALVEYKEEFGNLRVPPKYKTKYGLSLGSWVSSRRYEFKNGKIEAVRIKRLEDIGFVGSLARKLPPRFPSNHSSLDHAQLPA